MIVCFHDHLHTIPFSNSTNPAPMYQILGMILADDVVTGVGRFDPLAIGRTASRSTDLSASGKLQSIDDLYSQR